jgi:hypothetical protein
LQHNILLRSQVGGGSCLCQMGKGVLKWAIDGIMELLPGWVSGCLMSCPPYLPSIWLWGKNTRDRRRGWGSGGAEWESAWSAGYNTPTCLGLCLSVGECRLQYPDLFGTLSQCGGTKARRRRRTTARVFWFLLLGPIETELLVVSLVMCLYLGLGGSSRVRGWLVGGVVD